jgi:ABC-2 type transport system ATP-binding protein
MHPESTVQPPPALRLQGVTRHFANFDFGPVDLEVACGTTVGLLGVNGAGKSTLLRLLLGLLHADAGTVEVLGRQMPAEGAAAKRDIAFVSEDMALYAGATVGWHLEYVRGLVPVFDEAWARQLLGRFALRSEQRVRGLSRGQTVRLLLLLALVRRPRLLLLDEPTTGLDPRVRREVRLELADLAHQTGTTILFSSHLTEDVEALASEVVILHEGRIVRRAPTVQLLSEGPLDSVFLNTIAMPTLAEACA